MDTNYDWGMYEELREQLYSDLPSIEANILSLNKQEAVSESIDYLFRIFHNYKPYTIRLSLSPFFELVKKVENILGNLKNNKTIVQDSIIEWLLEVNDQLNIWHSEMEKNETILSQISKEFLNKVKITPSLISPSQSLKNLTVLYVDENKDRAKKITQYLKKLSNNVAYSSNIQGANKYLALNKVDILITNMKDENTILIEFVKDNFTDLPIIAVYDEITLTDSKKLLKQGITHSITNPIQAKMIQRELIEIIKVYYSPSNIIIDHKKITDFIQNLKPLPNTLLKIIQICDDDEIPIKELIKVVKSDPIISANILNIANSPLYGSVSIKTIDQAVTKFGKRVIKALAMSKMYDSLGEIDLKAYDITEEKFSDVSMIRLSLMLKWYAKISIADLSLLSSTALLGNIGQLLISKEIANSESIDEFKELSQSKGISYAEESIVCTNTNLISSQILRYWKLSHDITDVIAYSSNPKEAPLELQKLAIATHIVYELVDIKGNVKKEIPDNIKKLLQECDFDLTPLQNALDSLNI